MVKDLIRFVIAWVFIPIVTILLIMEWLLEDDAKERIIFSDWLSWATFDTY